MNGHQVPVLVVDDEEAMGLFLTRSLEKEGCSATVVKSGEEALDLLTQHSFDVVVLDLDVPGLSELEVLERIHKEHPYVAVIVTSALGDAHGAAEAIKKGALDYVLKPFDRHDFLRRIKEAREKRDLQFLEGQRVQMLEDQLRKSKDILREQFAQVVKSLAREHSLVYAPGDEGNNLVPEALKALPPELRRPLPSLQEYTSAVFSVIEAGKTVARVNGVDLALVYAMPPPGTPVTIQVARSDGGCALGFSTGFTWAVDGAGRLSHPVCRPAAAAMASLIQSPEGQGLEISCMCPLGRKVAFSVVQERGS